MKRNKNWRGTAFIAAGCVIALVVAGCSGCGVAAGAGVRIVAALTDTKMEPLGE